MFTRTVKTTLTFKHRFFLSALKAAQEPGTYLVETDEEQIENISFIAYRRVSTWLHVPALDRKSGIRQVICVEPEELEKLQDLDAQAPD